MFPFEKKDWNIMTVNIQNPIRILMSNANHHE